MALKRTIHTVILISCLFSFLFPKGVSSKFNSSTLGGISKAKITNGGNGGLDSNTLTLIKAFHRMDTYISESFNLNHNKNIDDADKLNNMNKLEEDILMHEPSKCVNDTERLIVGLLNGDGWAVQFFDAMGKPGPSLTEGRLNFVGNYDQCMSAKAPLEPSSDGEKADEFHGSYFQIALTSTSLPVLVKIGLCLPDTCSEKQVTSLGTEIIKAANTSFSVSSVHHLYDHTEVTSATIAAIVVSSLIGLMMILGTLFDIVFVQVPLWETERIKRDRTLYEEDKMASCDETRALLDNEHCLHVRKGALCCNVATKQTLQPRNIVFKILLAFSMYSNSKKIMNVSQSPGSLESIHGIRFLSITWVILAHTYVFATDYTVNLVGGYTKFLNRWTFDFISNGFLSVDTFFTLSGLLTSYLTIGQLLRKGLKLNWPLFYFHRFWRLTPPYMLVLLLYLGFQQYFIRGPLRNFEQPIDKSHCENHWWTNLLYINNLVKSREMCLAHSWYLANDMQFFILSPLMMIPFYFHHLAGFCSCFVLLLAGWTTSGLLSTINEWPATGVNLDKVPQGEKNDDWLSHYYFKPWCRIGPFIVGVLAGYVLAVYKGRPFYMKRWFVALGWTTATASALAVLYGLRGDITGDDPSSVGAAALYNSVARSVWGGCVSWVIIACTAGYGGPVNAILSWSPFVVLGRLSYMVYLIHVPIIFIFYQNLDRLFYMNDTTMVVYFLGFLVVSNLVAFVFMLGLESPMIGLEKAILKREK